MSKKCFVGIITSFFLVSFAFYSILVAKSGPFPVKGQIFDHNDQPFGTAHVYPRYVEIFDLENRQVGKVGILVEQGIAKLFLVEQSENRMLVGYATKGQIFNQNDKIVGTYFYTPTWSFVYDLKGVRAGKVKCIAWPRVCAVGVGGYLLKLYNTKGSDGKTP
ncbi:hypothetical protein KJ966_15890 [bacterium]|nr:hypothetical protein [bacterium]